MPARPTPRLESSRAGATCGRARTQAKIILNSTALLLATLGDLNSDLPAPVNAVRLLYVTGQAALPLAPAPAPAPTVAVPSPSSSGAGALHPRRAQSRSAARLHMGAG
jgi:hypothetical protein